MLTPHFTFRSFKLFMVNTDHNKLDPINHKHRDTPKRQGCSLVIINPRQEVLLLLRDDIPDIPYPGMWDIPGGAVEMGETPEQAIIREMAEEMDLVLKDFFLFCVTDFQDRQEYTYWTPLDLVIPEIDLKEGQKIQWFSWKDSQKITLAFEFNQTIDKFFREKPFLKI